MFQRRRCLIPVSFCFENCSLHSWILHQHPRASWFRGESWLRGPLGGPGLHRVLDFTQLGLQRNEAIDVWLPQLPKPCGMHHSPTLRHAPSPRFPRCQWKLQLRIPRPTWGPLGIGHGGAWRRLATPRYRADVPVSATAAISRM